MNLPDSGIPARSHQIQCSIWPSSRSPGSWEMTSILATRGNDECHYYQVGLRLASALWMWMGVIPKLNCQNSTFILTWKRVEYWNQTMSNREILLHVTRTHKAKCHETLHDGGYEWLCVCMCVPFSSITCTNMNCGYLLRVALDHPVIERATMIKTEIVSDLWQVRNGRRKVRERNRLWIFKIREKKSLSGENESSKRYSVLPTPPS